MIAGCASCPGSPTPAPPVKVGRDGGIVTGLGSGSCKFLVILGVVVFAPLMLVFKG